MSIEYTPAKTVNTANDAYKNTLKDVLASGTEVKAEESLSVGSNWRFKEILNYSLGISNPTQRLLTNSRRGFNLRGALARFV